MKLNFCGIVLRRIGIEDIELLRVWRNDKKIAKHMFYQEHISREMQLKWFKSLTPEDYYFIIELGDESVGMIHLSQDKHLPNTAFAGLFIYEESLWGSQIPVLASLCLLQFAFEQRGLSIVKAKTRRENIQALKYNKDLGFVKLSEELLQLDRSTYETKLVNLIAKIKRSFE